MAYLKRQTIPKNWPIPKKGTAYVVCPNFEKHLGLPILVVLRDILKVAATRKEVKKAINERLILRNNKEVRDDKNALVLLDTLSLVPSKKHYRLELSNKGKFELVEIKATEAGKKVSKVINKKTLKGKKTQINLIDGKNFISEVKCDIGDSVLINLKDKKIEKCLPLKEKSKVLVFQGKHAGEKGVIKVLDKERKAVEISEGDKSIKVLNKQVIVIE
ncbi:hypothetical protein HN832_02155 [archaeon]|jgi:small subunit ribosomal protein S4e|nr:hypothetical protein [archaeon]MBT4373157.1 hypothetical protein [archaeon]MBT4531502.1 hypothetical protein [archaeon]MBT7001320.1 hypothetical protein [archaeon]MBT7282194.1 hypothetical protein [archaeon]